MCTTYECIEIEIREFLQRRHGRVHELFVTSYGSLGDMSEGPSLASEKGSELEDWWSG